MAIQFQTIPGLTLNLKQRNRLKTYLAQIFIYHGYELENLSFIFCSDDYLLGINQQFLHHDTFTDIITFSLAPDGLPIVSEIFISVDRVKENALSFRTSFSNELHRVIFHGVLHLCGYKDKKKADKLLMTEQEDFHLLQYFS